MWVMDSSNLWKRVRERAVAFKSPFEFLHPIPSK